MKQKFLKSALCLCLLLPACNNQQEGTTSNPTADKATPAASADTPNTPAPAATAAQGNTISATVLETMNAGGYTYLQVDTGKVQQWVAIPESKVKVGDKVSYYDGMAMPNFTSKSLNRTFESIIFSPGLVGQGAPQAGPHAMNSTIKNDTPNPHAAMPEAGKPAGTDSFASAVQAEAPPATMQKMTASGGSLGAIAPYTEIKVEKAAGENGYNIEEIFAGNTKLDGKTIRVQGKVVKFSPNIMGKNWIHLQDGSGDPLKNTHDLVITTSAEPPKDKEVITIEGTVRANKDFGAGYSYVVIVEEAKIIQ
ncbi:MAG: DNA-binding protein [Proteobacteria bacterium]|nr:DNA-binding protein [Pseudomonadota bacterium]MBU1648946.1 DNA-binding protein [Pseudomonadota bacterium]